MKFFYGLFDQTTPARVDCALFFLRVGIGVLTIPHGFPKMMGGVAGWEHLGTFMHPLGIYFLPVMWGFLGAATEFFGGIMLVLGLGTRFASFCLTIMMFVATVWHINRGHDFMHYSFPLSLMVVFIAFILLGSGPWSLDYYLTRKNR